jgi:urease accessory protein
MLWMRQHSRRRWRSDGQTVQMVADLNDTFAANRAAGRIALSVAARGAATRRRRVYEDGPLRVRFPNCGGSALEAVIVNTAGGIAGGDRHDLDIDVGERSALRVVTAAAEKVYRSLGPAAEIAAKLVVGAGARLSWLPQEAILFDRARLARRIDVELAEGASLLMVEAVVFGRAAMGERVEQGSLTDRWRVRRGGRLVFAETIRLDGAVAQKLSQPAVANGGAAIATVLAVPGDEPMVERVRMLAFSGEVGVSAWNGLAVARLCAKDGAGLRRDLVATIGAFGGMLPRLWFN